MFSLKGETGSALPVSLDEQRDAGQNEAQSLKDKLLLC